MRPSLLLSLGLCLAPIAAQAQPYPLVSHQVAARDLPCFMHTSTNLSLDLSRLCAMSDPVFSGSAPNAPTTLSRSLPDIPADSAAIGVNANTGDLIGIPILQGNASGSSAGSNTGPCQVASDRDSAGRRCGGRAASER